MFGCVCYVRDVNPQLTKLDPKSMKCIFVGYSRLQKGYKCFCPSLHKHLVSIDVTFVEDLAFFPLSDSKSCVQEESGSDDWLIYPTTLSQGSEYSELNQRIETNLQESDNEEIPAHDPSVDLPIALRKGTRQCTNPISSFVSYDKLYPTSYTFISNLDTVSIPKNVREALSKPEWQKAMLEEIEALDHNKT